MLRIASNPKINKPFWTKSQNLPTKNLMAPLTMCSSEMIQFPSGNEGNTDEKRNWKKGNVASFHFIASICITPGHFLIFFKVFFIFFIFFIFFYCIHLYHTWSKSHILILKGGLQVREGTKRK